MINLDATKVKAFLEGAVTVETVDKAAVTDIRFNYDRNTVSIWVNYGALVSSALSESNRAAPLLLEVDLTTGDVRSEGQVLGTLSPAQLTSFQNTAKSLRNSAETFLVNVGLVVGTQTAW